MSDTEIQEGNKLIAEFMNEQGSSHKNAYAENWNALMPVVEKIAVDYDVRISWFDKDCVCTISNTSLEGSEIADFGNFTPAIINVWKAVVKLIEYHNQKIDYYYGRN